MSTTQICYQFQSHGFCTYGKDCTFSHINRPPIHKPMTNSSQVCSPRDAPINTHNDRHLLKATQICQM
ncbi:hypothetical protein L208DRAFT_1407677 [Tricholoma matsutake]|nr:hypothetical protein L208DRAFT_1407677 [Tricholoma matsutake 945]